MAEPQQENNITALCSTISTQWKTQYPNATTDSEDNGLTTNMMSACNTDHIIDIIYTCAMFIMAMAGILGNFFVIGAVFVHRKLRVISNVFIVNLAVADLMVCCITDIFGIVGVITKGEIFKNNPGFCDFLGCVCVTSCCCSLWSITAIALNRYVAICHRLIYPAIYNKRTVPFMIAGLWILSFMIDVPALSGWGGHSYTKAILYCTYDFMSNYNYAIFLTVWQFGIPVILLSYSYFRILLFSRAIKKSLRKWQKSDVVQSGSSSIHSTDMRLLRSVLTIWITFCALWTPYVALLLMRNVTHLPRFIFILATAMAHLSSSINCFVYGLTNQNFREGYLIIIKKLKPCGAKLKSRIVRPTGTMLKSPHCSSMSLSQSSIHSKYQFNDSNQRLAAIHLDAVGPIVTRNSEDFEDSTRSGIPNLLFIPE